MWFRNIHVALRDVGELPDLALQIMEDGDWRNLGETLAAL
jgi:hypothetical protein